MRLAPEIERLISASRLRLRIKSPFFATLALFTHFQATQALPNAATDGQDIFFNPDLLRSLSSTQIDGLLLHQVLHAALLHVPRRGSRKPELWNAAADIVVNGMIAQQGDFELPSDALRDPQLENLSAEEIYEILLQKKPHCSPCQLDLLSQPPPDAKENERESQGEREKGTGKARMPANQGAERNSQSQIDSGSLADARQAVLEAHWRSAMQQAITVAHSTNNQGSIPAGMQRELKALTQAKLDWRSHLWRYLVRTPNDFMGFDRRFIGRRLYLEALQGESVQVFVAVDTSGSIGDQQMWLFLSEVQGILKAYPHLRCELYYADAQAYGPYPLEADSKIPPPLGGGGTSFVPFFDKVSANRDWHTSGVCVYLTDGYGTFPKELPDLPVLWVVTPGGLDMERFPFGETVRLLSIP